jgi:hypothetical protein
MHLSPATPPVLLGPLIIYPFYLGFYSFGFYRNNIKTLFPCSALRVNRIRRFVTKTIPKTFFKCFKIKR